MTRSPWTHHLLAPLAPLVLTSLALGACRGEDPIGASATAGETSTSGDATEGMTSTGGETDDESTGGTTEATTSAGSETSAGFITTAATTSGGPTALPNGAQCQADSECESMKCYVVPMFGGVCSECKSDSDCVEAGSGIACSFNLGTMQATCTDGGLGSSCESQASCEEGLYCDEVISGTFGLVPNACGECRDSGDCDGEQICSPVLDFMMLSGYKACVEPGSVQNNELCPDGPDGDLACASGSCGDVDAFGFITLGVCGECTSDEDCEDGTCMEGSFSEGGPQGAVCG